MSHLLFSTKQYENLAGAIANRLKAEQGQVESKLFPDGERYLRILSDVRGRDVIIVGGSVDDRSMLDLFDLGCAVSAYGARSLKLLIPFYGYSTMEREVKPGEVVTAKTRARIFSAIPITPFGNLVMMLDLHAEGIPLYFEGPVKTRHLYAKNVILKEARELGGTNFTLGSVDAGRAKWVESLANDLGVPAGFVYKRRSHTGEVSIAGVNISVAGQNVVIYDDMIRSGGSLIQAAQAYKDAGAEDIFAITTHGIFTSGAIERIKASGLFKKVIATDSHPNALSIKDPILKIVSVAGVFADAIEK